jgi:hypothetical protein
LTEEEKELFADLRRQHKRQLEIHDRRKAALGSLRTKIQDTVTRTNLEYTFGCDTPHDMVAELKVRLAPTENTRRLELIAKYQELRKLPKHSGLDEWLQAWESVCKQGEKADIGDAMGERVVNDFLTVVKPLEPEFTGYWKNHMEELESTLSIHHTIIQRFRKVRQKRLLEPQEKNPDLAFTSFKGQNLEGGNQSDRTSTGQSGTSKEKRKPRCKACPRQHEPEDCFYFNEWIRPDDRKPRTDMTKRAAEAIKRDSKPKAQVEQLKTKSKKGVKAKEQKPSSSQVEEVEDKAEDPPIDISLLATRYLSTNGSCPLRDSFVYDSGATIHICNKQSCEWTAYFPTLPCGSSSSQ